MFIYFIGCVDIDIIPKSQREHQHKVILNDTVEECYLKCQNENISCGQNEPIYFALKVTLQIKLI